MRTNTEHSETGTRRLTIFASFPYTPLTDHLPSGDGLLAYQLICRLAMRGHRLHVATPRAELILPLPKDVIIHQMKAGHGEGLSPNPLIYMTWTRRVLRQVCKAEHVDLIHELNPVFSLRSLAFAFVGVPLVLGPHSSRWPMNLDGNDSRVDLIRQRIQLFFKNLVVNQQHKRADAVLLSTVAALNNVGHPEDHAGRLFVLPPGIDIEEFKPCADEKTEQPTILFLARMIRQKGIYSLLDAFAQLNKRMPAVRLTIAGDGSDLEAVKNLIAASSFRNKVECLGHVERAGVPRLMQQCSIYCLPSQGEPFGMTAVEAMACGKPLVVTRGGGLTHLVSDEGGRRVEIGDSAGLANALEELLSHPELLRRMGEHNRRTIEKLYAWPVVAGRLEKIYYQVLDRDGAPNPDLVTDQDIAIYRSSQQQATSVPALAGVPSASHGV